jgi:thiamine monophosphate kinase
MDNSDGLLPTIERLAATNRAARVIDVERLGLPSGGAATDLSIRTCLGWGDWNVIVSVDSMSLNMASEIAAAAGAELVPIGEVVDSLTPSAYLHRSWGAATPAPGWNRNGSP